MLPSEISLDLVYDTLKELKDEVASNMLDSLIGKCAASIDDLGSVSLHRLRTEDSAPSFLRVFNLRLLFVTQTATGLSILWKTSIWTSFSVRYKMEEGRDFHLFPLRPSPWRLKKKRRRCGGWRKLHLFPYPILLLPTSWSSLKRRESACRRRRSPSIPA